MFITHSRNQVVEMWETNTGSKEMKCQWFYRPTECQHDPTGLSLGQAVRLRFHVEVIAHALAGLEFMRLHPQEVFLTIHDDPNPISTIVSGTVYPNPRPPFFPSAQFDFGFELLLPSTLLLYKQFTSCRLRCPLLQ